MPLPDELIEISPGVPLRSFSAEHLLHGNPQGRRGLEDLTAALLELGTSAPSWPHASTAQALGARLKELATGPKTPMAVDRSLLERAIRGGHGLGLGAAWGVSREADLLWAGAARMLQLLGVEHSNDLC